MMTMLPLCPRCEEEELRRVTGTVIMARCYECGWSSGLLAKDIGQDATAVIEEAVRKYKQAKARA